MYRLARPWLFALGPEDSHDRVLSTLAFAARRRWATGGIHALYGRKAAPLPVRVMGIDFPNPLGLAAGLDKQGNASAALAAFGFGWVELGTVTPPAPAGQPETEDVPAGVPPGHHQPHGFQQRRARCLSPEPPVDDARHHPRYQHRQERRHTAGGRRRRLPVLPGAGVPPCGLHHRQHLLAQHRGSSVPPGKQCSRPTPGDPLRSCRKARRPARQAGAPRAQAGAGSRRPADRSHCGIARPARNRRGGGRQHHGVQGGSGRRPARRRVRRAERTPGQGKRPPE